jgi:tetratricopeptide (TPR) repeat protein
LFHRRGKMKGPTEGNQYDDVLKDISFYYKILGLDFGADKDRLIETYKNALEKWVHERYVDDPLQQKKAIEMTKKLDEAYENILFYMRHPKYQHHLSNKSVTPETKPQSTYKEKQQAEGAAVSEGKGPSVPGISLSALKSLASIPNAAFFASVCLILGFTTLKQEEALSFYLIPQILSQSAWFIVPPLIGCVAFNLVHGEARVMKYASIALTITYLFLVFPYETGLYHELLHKDEVVLKTKTTDAPDKGWISSGNALKSAGKYKASVQAYSKALEINPGSSDAYYGRAIAYSMLEKDREFISDLRDAARLGNIDAIKILNRLDLRY